MFRILTMRVLYTERMFKILDPLWTMHLVFKNSVQKRHFKNWVFFANLRMWAKKFEARVFLIKKFNKNWEFHEKSLCKIETVTKQFPQAWDKIMPHKIFFQSSLSFWPIKCSYPYYAGSIHRKDVQNSWPLLNNAPGF